MKRWIVLLSTALCFAVSVIDSSQAGGAPPALYNKTVTLSWNILMSARTPDGAVKNISAARERVVYISDKGNLFVRERRGDGRGNLNQVENREPGNTKNYTGNSSAIRFEGNQLVAITGQVSGANLMRATFDSSFSSCTMTWMAGKSGSGHTVWKGSDGVSYDIISATPGTTSCSIRAGNAFAS
jgi:hypothetical protein